MTVPRSLPFSSSCTPSMVVPPGLVVVRPTHFADSAKKSSPQNLFGYAGVNRTDLMVGINVSFQNLIAAAYNFNPGRVALPAGARGDLGAVGDREDLATSSDVGEEVANPRCRLAAHPGVHLIEDQQGLATPPPAAAEATSVP